MLLYKKLTITIPDHRNDNSVQNVTVKLEFRTL